MVAYHKRINSSLGSFQIPLKYVDQHVIHISTRNYLGTIFPDVRHVWVVTLLKFMQLCKWMKYAWLQIILLIKETTH